MKTMNKTLALLLAMIMIFTLSIGAFADEGQPSEPTNNISPDATYIVCGTPDAINVNVSIQGLSIPYQTHAVTLPAKTDGVQHVIDAILAINRDSSIGLTFETKDSETNQFRAVQPGDTYFSRIRYGNDAYDAGSGSGFSGWTFRVNNLIPLEGPTVGASIASALVFNGNEISFYIDNPASEATAARFTRISSAVRDGSDLVVTVEESHQYFTGEDYVWTVTPFEPYADEELTVDIMSGSTVVASGSTEEGIARIDVSGLSTGTYRVVVDGPEIDDGNIILTACEKTVEISNAQS